MQARITKTAKANPHDPNPTWIMSNDIPIFSTFQYLILHKINSWISIENGQTVCTAWTNVFVFCISTPFTIKSTLTGIISSILITIYLICMSNYFNVKSNAPFWCLPIIFMHFMVVYHQFSHGSTNDWKDSIILQNFTQNSLINPWLYNCFLCDILIEIAVIWMFLCIPQLTPSDR